MTPLQTFPDVAVVALDRNGLQFHIRVTDATWSDRLRSQDRLSPPQRKGIASRELEIRRAASFNDRLLAFSRWRHHAGHVDADVFEAGWSAYKASQWAATSGRVPPARLREGLRSLMNGETPSYMAPSGGCNLTIRTADDFVLYVQRSDQVSQFPGSWNVSVNEGANMEDVVEVGSERIYLPQRTMLRGAAEELNLQFATADLPVVKIHTMTITSTGDMGLLGHVDLTPLGVTSDVLRRGLEDAPHKWEMQEARFVPWNAPSVDAFLQDGMQSGRFLPWALLHFENSALSDGLDIVRLASLPRS